VLIICIGIGAEAGTSEKAVHVPAVENLRLSAIDTAFPEMFPFFSDARKRNG
jgi:hypothetical protein